MLTIKQVTNILDRPLHYSKATRHDAVKRAIEILDKMAIADGAKEQATALDRQGHVAEVGEDIFNPLPAR